MESGSTLEVGVIIMGLFGGLALFLFGMEQMTDALKHVAGNRMKNMLARITDNRFKAATAGAFVTAIIQSSSVTTVLVVGFISAGLMTLQQSIGIIMGANIGTTITAQIIAFKVTKYSLILVSVGFGMMFLVKKEKIKYYGTAIMGLGLVFFGMEMMSSATRPLRDYQPFIDMMQSMENPLWGILVSAAFTGLIQSSSATTGVILVLATQGFITLEAGIALAFGANIGTCVTALLASIGKPREAIQAAVVHVLFNVGGVIIWIGLIDQLAWVVRDISPTYASLTGVERLSAEAPRQIANAHTLFNVINTMIFIWFTKPMARLVQFLVPERKAAEGEVVQSRYLDDILYQTPSLALDRARMEIRRLAERALEMVSRALQTVVHGDKEALQSLAKMDDEVDALHGYIVTYLAELSQENLSHEQSQQLSMYMNQVNYIENIGDLIETNIVEDGLKRIELNLQISPSTEEALKALHEKITWCVQLAFQAIDASNPLMAQQVIDAKSEVNRLALRAEEHIAERLTADAGNRLELFQLESELVEYLKRVYYFSKRIAKSITELYEYSDGVQDQLFEVAGS